MGNCIKTERIQNNIITPIHSFKWNTKISTEHFDILYVVSDNAAAARSPLLGGPFTFYMTPEIGTTIMIFSKPTIIKLGVPRSAQQLKVWSKILERLILIYIYLFTDLHFGLHKKTVDSLLTLSEELYWERRIALVD